MEKIKCPICGTLINDDPYSEACPKCAWVYTGVEDCYDPDEKEDFNLMSVNKAKKLLAEGKDKWGNPLPKK
ncbi:MAG: hypothetical protein K2I29_05650 [Clostridia bacterium]|nr:hypothetical protein [Clostridia bacterium]